jgi:anti-sigma factor RsiW
VNTADISCRELVELLTSYLDGSLEPQERRRLDAHLKDCEGCTNALAQLRTTIEVTGRLTEEAAAAPERESIRAVFRRWRSERPPGQGPGPPSPGAAG